MRTRLLRLLRIPGFKSLIVATFALGIAMSLTTPYLSLFGVEQAKISPIQIGVFMTLIAASTVSSSAFAGRWSDKRGQQCQLLLVTLAGSSLGYLLLCTTRSYLALLAIGVLFLGAGGAAMSLAFSFARSVLPVTQADDRAFALAIQRTVLSTAWVFGPSIGAFVLTGLGFTGLFLFASACFGSCGILVWSLGRGLKLQSNVRAMHHVSDSCSPSDLTATEPELRLSLHDGTRASRMVIARAAVSITLIGLAMSAMMIVLPLYVIHGIHGARIDVSIMLGLGALLEIPMMLALGARSHRLDKQRWLAAGAAVHVIYFVGVATAQSVEVLIPMQAFNAFVVAVTSCLGLTYIQELMPRAPGAATALFFNASRVGSILSGVLAGFLVSAVGYRGTFLICAALATVAFALFANPIIVGAAVRARNYWSARRQL
jgi:MFS transporter, SET family, sugar efflux transporter